MLLHSCSLVTSLCLCWISALTHPESTSSLFGYFRVSHSFIMTNFTPSFLRSFQLLRYLRSICIGDVCDSSPRISSTLLSPHFLHAFPISCDCLAPPHVPFPSVFIVHTCRWFFAEFIFCVFDYPDSCLVYLSFLIPVSCSCVSLHPVFLCSHLQP